MTNSKLDELIKKFYNSRVEFIKSKNIELERAYFSENIDRIPMGAIMANISYEERFISFHYFAKTNDQYVISQIYNLLTNYFLFSAGHDFMFKQKLEADLYNSAPIEQLIYPMLMKKINQDYNDISIMNENSKLDNNLQGIKQIMYQYEELSSLLYLLYCHDFQFPKGWEEMFPDTSAKLIKILDEEELTIGTFLNALIDDKCQTMIDIFSEIENPLLKEEYLAKTEKLRNLKHAEIQTFNHINLPVTYFLNHTYEDFLNGKDVSSVPKKKILS